MCRIENGKDARRPDVVRNSHPPDDQKRREDRTEKDPRLKYRRGLLVKKQGAFQRSPVLRGPVPGSRPCCFNGLRSRCYRSAGIDAPAAVSCPDSPGPGPVIREGWPG